MDILSYTGEVLSRLMINMETRKDCAFSNPHIKFLMGRITLPAEREVVRIRSLFNVLFLLFRTGGDYVLVGPYMTDFISEGDIDEEMLEKLGVSPKQLMLVPVVPESGLFRPLMETLFDTLWGKGNYDWRDMDTGDSISVSIYRDNMEYYDADRVSRRYRNEAKLLDAVRRCDLDSLSSFSSASIDESIEKRNDNPVRNIQNYSIIMNTLLRKTAYDAGVAAIYVDRLSSLFGRRIEKVSTSLAVRNLIGEMLREYALLIRDYSWKDYPENIRAVLFVIDSRYRQHMTLDELSASAGLSPSYLSRVFAKVMGKTVSEYINEVRISKSLDLLKEPDITVASAAIASGFEDQAYYTRTFRKVKGMTPTEWRKKHGR